MGVSSYGPRVGTRALYVRGMAQPMATSAPVPASTRHDCAPARRHHRVELDDRHPYELLSRCPVGPHARFAPHPHWSNSALIPGSDLDTFFFIGGQPERASALTRPCRRWARPGPWPYHRRGRSRLRLAASARVPSPRLRVERRRARGRRLLFPTAPALPTMRDPDEESEPEVVG